MLPLLPSPRHPRLRPPRPLLAASSACLLPLSTRVSSPSYPLETSCAGESFGSPCTIRRILYTSYALLSAAVSSECSTSAQQQCKYAPKLVNEELDLPAAHLHTLYTDWWWTTGPAAVTGMLHACPAVRHLTTRSLRGFTVLHLIAQLCPHLVTLQMDESDVLPPLRGPAVKGGAGESTAPPAVT